MAVKHVKSALEPFLTKIKDTKLLLEMENAIKADSIILFPEYLQINFPQGVLPSQVNSHTIAIEYSDLDNLMYSWAIPNSEQ